MPSNSRDWPDGFIPIPSSWQAWGATFSALYILPVNPGACVHQAPVTRRDSGTTQTVELGIGSNPRWHPRYRSGFMADRLIAVLQAFRGNAPRHDDQSFFILRQMVGWLGRNRILCVDGGVMAKGKQYTA